MITASGHAFKSIRHGHRAQWSHPAAQRPSSWAGAWDLQDALAAEVRHQDCLLPVTVGAKGGLHADCTRTGTSYSYWKEDRRGAQGSRGGRCPASLLDFAQITALHEPGPSSPGRPARPGRPGPRVAPKGPGGRSWVRRPVSISTPPPTPCACQCLAWLHQNKNGMRHATRSWRRRS